MDARLSISEIDIDDDAGVDELLAFEAAHGTPRYDRNGLRAAFPEPLAWSLITARDAASGELVGTAQGIIFSASDTTSIAANPFALPGRVDVLRALLARLAEWEAASDASVLVAHVSNVTDRARADLEAAGLTFGNKRSRMERVITPADRTIDVACPPGIVLTHMAARPDVADQLRDRFNEALRDIPTVIPFVDVTDETLRDQVELGAGEAWPERVRIALDGDRVVGFTIAAPLPGPGVVSFGHRLTGVARSHRGRGIASALKQDLIRWAAGQGIELLTASNDEDNLGMIAVNRALGYRVTRTISLFTLDLE